MTEGQPPGEEEAGVPLEAVRTGQLTTVRLLRGSGRAIKEEAYGVGPEGPYDTPILGGGRYYTDDPEFARSFGPNVEETSVAVRNPLVIDSDAAWTELIRRAGWRYANPFGLPRAEVRSLVERSNEVIRQGGHDAVVVRLPDFERYGDIAKTLTDVFGGNTVYIPTPPCVLAS